MSAFDLSTIPKLATEFEDLSAKHIIEHGLKQFGDSLAISFSGAEDVVLIDLASRSGLPFRVFTLDTGRLHPQTYRYLEVVRKHYAIDIEVCTPDSAALTALTTQKGMFSFYADGHQECCGIRKVGPLREKLATLDAWITGQRADQSPGTRADVPFIQQDNGFGSDANPLVKYNPLSQWTSARVWGYIRENKVPYNELHEQGFVSLGCEPCTRPVLPNQHEREGRWWWEEATQKECGLHSINIEPIE